MESGQSQDIFNAIERGTRRRCLLDEGHPSSFPLLSYTLVRALLAVNFACKLVTLIGGLSGSIVLHISMVAVPACFLLCHKAC